jgi:hypothetical protein
MIKIFGIPFRPALNQEKKQNSIAKLPPGKEL